MAYYPPKPGREEKQPEPVSRRKTKTLRDRVLLCLCALLVAYSGIRLIAYGADRIASRDTRDRLKEAAQAETPAEAPETEAPAEAMTEVPAETPEADGNETASGAEEPAPAPALPGNETGKPSLRLTGRLPEVPYPGGTEVNNLFRKLRKQSKYIVGWISMNGVDEPVVKKDNTYFLDHDAMGKKNSNGAIFLDERVSLLTRPYTLLLYGHNMKSGAMFGDLRKYKDYAYCARHRVFTFDTMYEEGKYAVFSVAVIGTEPGTTRYIDFNCLTSDDRELRKKELQKLESLDEGGATVLAVDEEDQLLLLITCTGDDTERLVVAARRLRDGEREDSLHFRAN